MKLRELKKQMLLPKREFVINKRANIQGVDVHILSLTQQGNHNFLWLMYQDGFENELDEKLEYRMEQEYKEKTKTNREKRLENIERRSKEIHFFIKEMEIQKQIISFEYSKSNRIYDVNREGIMQLQHFIEKGLTLDEWDDVTLENLVIARYEQNKDGVLHIGESKKLNIKLEINPSSREIPIQHSFKIEFGKQNKGRKITYYDEELGKENWCFINEIYSYDIYEDIKMKAERIEDVEMRENMLNNVMEALERVCPRDKNLAVIKYETMDDIQFNFYMKAYLDEEIIARKDGASSFGIIGEKGMGVNGHRMRECILQPIDKNFDGELELELFLRYLNIPGEIISIE